VKQSLAKLKPDPLEKKRLTKEDVNYYSRESLQIIQKQKSLISGVMVDINGDKSSESDSLEESDLSECEEKSNEDKDE
jgi:hypothetical protein